MRENTYLNKFMRLDSTFYMANDVVNVAKGLLGTTLYTKIGGALTAGIIVETEAYSAKEKACHAYNNRYTERTKVFFDPGGTAYVYLCYGIHKLFNIVTNKAGIAEAVLIRALEPVEGIETMAKRRKMVQSSKALTSGPGKLTKAMGIDMQHNRLSLLGDEIWIEQNGFDLLPSDIKASPRIGVDYAEEDALLPWRFTIKDNPWVSK